MEDTKVTFKVPGGTCPLVKSPRISVWNANGGELFLELNSEFMDGNRTLFHINGILDLHTLLCFEAKPASPYPVSVHVQCV